MEIPNLVRERLGGESIEATVNLGDEDIVYVTPTRTILYRGEGLLSDESVEVYSHDVERLDVSEGRRNTKFVLEYVDGTKEFKVPGDRTDTLLKILLQGILQVAGVAEQEESVAGVFQFSELTLVVTDARLVKHIGTPVWDSDFEVFDYADVTGLDFEEGSVATQIILTVDGRPQRIKAPNDQAPQVEQTLTQTLCAYYDVRSLEELAAQLTDEDPNEAETPDPASAGEFELDDGISPLVGGSEGEADDRAITSPGQSTEEATTSTIASPTDDAGSDRSSSPESTREATSESASERADADVDTVTTPETPASAGVDPEEFEAIKDQLATLTEAVKRQNKLLRSYDERIEDHDEKIDQLIEELRRGR